MYSTLCSSAKAPVTATIQVKRKQSTVRDVAARSQGNEVGWLDRMADDHRRMGAQFMGIFGSSTSVPDVKQAVDNQQQAMQAEVESALADGADTPLSSSQSLSTSLTGASYMSAFATSMMSMDDDGAEATHEAWTTLLQSEAKAQRAKPPSPAAAAREDATWVGSHSTHSGLEAQEAADYEARILAGEARAAVMGAAGGFSSDDEDGAVPLFRAASSRSDGSAAAAHTATLHARHLDVHVSGPGGHSYGNGVSAAVPSVRTVVTPVVVAAVTQSYSSIDSNMSSCDASESEDGPAVLMPLHKAVQMLAAQGQDSLGLGGVGLEVAAGSGSDSDGEGGGWMVRRSHGGVELLGPCRFLDLPEAPLDATQLDAAALAAAVLLQREASAAADGHATKAATLQEDTAGAGDAVDVWVRAAPGQERERPGATVSVEDVQQILGPRRSA